MNEQLKPWHIALIALICLALASAVGSLAFVLGQRLGAAATPTLIPSPTSPFPLLRTATPTAQPSRTSTPTPTSTPTRTPTSTPTPTPTPRVIITDVQALGRLETSRFMMQTVIDLEREPANVWEEFLGTDKLLLVAGGEVVAGFDLTQVQKADIIVSGDRVTIVLPAPQILYSKVDNDLTYVYERTTGLFRSPDLRIESEARQLAERAMIDRALEGQILSQAEVNGRRQLEALLRSLGFTEVLILVPTE